MRTAHAATEILDAGPVRDGKVPVRLRLACGCVFEGTIAADRLLEVVTDAGDGVRAVGKYPCPVNHAPRPA